MGKRDEVLNLIRNPRLCSCQKEKISTDGCMSGDHVYFARNNRRKLLVRERLRDTGLQSPRCHSLHVRSRSTQAIYIRFSFGNRNQTTD